jgi:DNA-binding NarL/FixJ family response regulator
MAALPRILTIDPTWALARVVRAATDLVDRAVIQVDVPGGSDALDELSHGGAKLAVTSWVVDDEMRGLELALRIKQTSPDTAVIILGDVSDPEELDDETLSESPFVYLRRPVDIHQFMRVLVAGLDGSDIFEALTIPSSSVARILDRGPVPAIDFDNALAITKRLMSDVGAMAIIMANRSGDVILEQGAVGYLNRDQLVNALIPMMTTTVEMSTLVGGQAQNIQFYDGDDKDVFVFSIGLHYFLCLAFDGQAGQRQFGVVNTFGRRAVQDLVMLLGPSAWQIQSPKPAAETRHRAKRATQDIKAAELEEPLETLIPRAEPTAAEPEAIHLEPISDDLFDPSFLDGLGELQDADFDSMFDADKLADIAHEGKLRSKTLSQEEAEGLGLLGGLGGGG